MALFILRFVAVVVCYQVRIANAFQGLSGPPGPLAAASKEQPAATGKAPQKPAAGAVADTEKGKKVFETVCSVCHRFDAKVVGPPLNEVVPKYKGDLAKLKAFIKAPTKVNPAFPPMPPPGIKDDEIDAVAKYLLATVKGGK
jgi:cytochrome c551/c552